MGQPGKQEADAFNQSLSQKRSAAVVGVYVVDEEQLTTKNEE